jgi:hypothetical protein
MYAGIVVIPDDIFISIIISALHAFLSRHQQAALTNSFYVL